MRRKKTSPERKESGSLRIEKIQPDFKKSTDHRRNHYLAFLGIFRPPLLHKKIWHAALTTLINTTYPDSSKSRETMMHRFSVSMDGLIDLDWFLCKNSTSAALLNTPTRSEKNHLTLPIYSENQRMAMRALACVTQIMAYKNNPSRLVTDLQDETLHEKFKQYADQFDKPMLDTMNSLLQPLILDYYQHKKYEHITGQEARSSIL
jgi:hypothetical protein